MMKPKPDLAGVTLLRLARWGWLVAVLFMAGCAADRTPTRAEATPESTLTETATIRPTKAVPSRTPTVTATASPSSTPTPMLRPGILRDCWPVMDAFPSSREPTGKLLVDVLKGTEWITYIYDVQNQSKILIPTKGRYLLYPRTSPDGKRIAARWVEKSLDDPTYLVVFDSNGNTIHSIPYAESWGIVSGWIDNERILIQKKQQYPLRTLYVVDPVKGQVRELPPKYPDMDFLLNNTWNNSGLTIYDPSLQLVVYPEITEQGHAIVLSTVADMSVILRLRDPVGLSSDLPPQWTQNGEKFAVFGGFRYPFTVVYRDGTVQHSQIDLQQYRLPYYIGEYNWSPDGRYLAIWIFTEGYDHETLVIWDTQEDTIVDTCIENVRGNLNFGNSPWPFWSTDGKYIAVQSHDPNEDWDKPEYWDLLVVSMEDHFAVKVIRDAAAWGWLVRDP